MQMRAAQNQNALAQYQLSSAQREDAATNALNMAYQNAYDPATGKIDPNRLRQSLASSGAGAKIPGVEKALMEAEKGKTELQTAQTTLLKNRLALLPDAYRIADTPEAYAQLQNTIHADPVIGPWLDSLGSTKEKSAAALQDALAKPNGFDQFRIGAMKSVKDILEGTKPLVVAAGSSVFDPKSQSFVGTAPEKTPTYAPSADQQGYEVAKAEGFKGTFLDYKLQLARAGRAAVAEPAPTITPVVDPKNPKQMLNVNARLYRGGSIGDPGVIGVAGREPGYVAREEKAATKQTETDKSKGQVDALVAQLGGYYDVLASEGGITDPKLRAGSNAMAGLASSNLGQATGRFFGTQAQSQRNSIAQTRPLLLQAIKNATGMSAKQMDSNVELKMLLATATDPQLDIESNRRALASLAALYGTGSGAVPPPTPSPGAPTRANAAKARAAPAGVAAELWNVMTPEEQKLWQK
jgi:hypothetical protein